MQTVHAHLFRSLHTSKFPSHKLPFIITKGKYNSTSVIFKSLRFLPVKQDIHFKLVWTNGPGKKEGTVKQQQLPERRYLHYKKQWSSLTPGQCRRYAYPFLWNDKKISFQRKGKILQSLGILAFYILLHFIYIYFLRSTQFLKRNLTP